MLVKDLEIELVCVLNYGLAITCLLLVLYIIFKDD